MGHSLFKQIDFCYLSLFLFASVCVFFVSFCFYSFLFTKRKKKNLAANREFDSRTWFIFFPVFFFSLFRYRRFHKRFCSVFFFTQTNFSKKDDTLMIWLACIKFIFKFVLFTLCVLIHCKWQQNVTYFEHVFFQSDLLRVFSQQNVTFLNLFWTRVFLQSFYYVSLLRPWLIKLALKWSTEKKLNIVFFYWENFGEVNIFVVDRATAI